MRYAYPSEISHTADRLRWHRHRCGLLQKDVAEYIGLRHSTYKQYENRNYGAYPLEKLQQAARLFAIPWEELLDDYNRFLYQGQGLEIKKRRKTLHLTQAEYARLLQVPLSNLKSWENERCQISRRM